MDPVILSKKKLCNFAQNLLWFFTNILLVIDKSILVNYSNFSIKINSINYFIKKSHATQMR